MNTARRARRSTYRVLALMLLVLAAGCQSNLVGIQRFGSSQVAKVKRITQRPRDASYRAPQDHNFAIDHLSKKEQAEGYSQVQLAVAISLEDEGDMAGALSAYEAAIKNDRKNARAYHRVALLHAKAGRTAPAGEMFEKALNLATNDATLHSDYGYFQYSQRRYGAAEQHLRRATELEPHLARAHNNLGMVLGKVGRTDEALRHFKAAGLTEADARANLVLALVTEDRMPEASAQLELALKADPTAKAAREYQATFKKVNIQRPNASPKPKSTAAKVVHASAAKQVAPPSDAILVAKARAELPPAPAVRPRLTRAHSPQARLRQPQSATHDLPTDMVSLIQWPTSAMPAPAERIVIELPDIEEDDDRATLHEKQPAPAVRLTPPVSTFRFSAPAPTVWITSAASMVNATPPVRNKVGLSIR